MSMATTTSKSLLYVLQNSLSGETTVAQCQPQVVYMIFTIAIGFLCTLRGLKDATGAVTKRLDTQIALHSCSEALSKMAETWPLAQKYGRAVQVLMDAEGLESLESRSYTQRDPAIEPTDRRNSLSAVFRNNYNTQQAETLSGGSTNSMNGMAPNNQYTHHPASIGGLHEQFPSIDEITGTTGWGTDNLDHFDFSDIPFDRHNTGLDPDLHAFLSSFAAVPGNSFPSASFNTQNPSRQQSFALTYDSLPINQNHQDEGQSYDVGHVSGHALDLLAYSAVNRQTK
jgi:hypothetical protein